MALSISLAACVSFKEEQVTVWEQTVGIAPMSASGIGGDYLNRCADPNNAKPFLWSHLMMRPDTSHADDVVRIVHVGPDRLRFLLMRGGTGIDSAEEDCERFTTHVRFAKNNVRGAPPIAWAVVSSAIAIGADSSGGLSVLRRTSGAVFLVIIPFGGGGLPFAVNYMRAP